jgi:hypothetical protein
MDGIESLTPTFSGLRSTSEAAWQGNSACQPAPSSVKLAEGVIIAMEQ